MSNMPLKTSLNMTGAAQCIICPMGRLCITGSIAPGDCEAGHYCPEGANASIPCPSGTFSNSTDLSEASECMICPPGKIYFLLKCPIESLGMTEMYDD